MDAAMQEFGEKGYELSTVNAICKEYNISKGLLYHNFQGKDELYLICVEKCFTEMTEYLKNLDIQDDLCVYMESRLQFFSENPYYTRLFFEAVLQPPVKLREKIAKIKKPFNLLNKNVYRNVVAKMRLRDGITERQAVEYYEVMQDMFNGYFSTQVFQRSSFDAVVHEHEKHLVKILDYMLYGIAKKGEE